MSGFDDIAAELDALKARELYRRRRRLDGPQGRELLVDGRRLLNFCSNDYLGLAADPRVAEAFRAGVDRWGSGAGASHLVCGHTAAHAELEEALADFTGRPRALLFSSGYAANVGTINALLSRGDAVFQDRLNHASLLDGGWISRADFHWYRHLDTAQLERKLLATGARARRRLVVSDGTFSMDGDLAPLESLVPIARASGAWLMIDDAHGIGVLGEQGRGLVDPARWTTAEVPVLVGTLGKALGCCGAFVAGSDALIDYLVQRARNYIYTTALPPAVACATLRSLEIARSEDWRRERLAALIRRFRRGAEEIGLAPAASTTPIQPLIVGEAGKAMAFSRALEEQGLMIGAIRPPTVPKDTARLRITLTAAHSEADVDRLLAALDVAARRIRAA